MWLVVLLSLAREENVSWNSVLIGDQYNGQWDKDLETWFFSMQTSTRLALAAPTCAVLTCRCLPSIPWLPLIVFLLHYSCAPLPWFFGCWRQYGVEEGWVWWASTNRKARRENETYLVPQDCVFPCYYKCCNFPFSQLLFTRSPG